MDSGTSSRITSSGSQLAPSSDTIKEISALTRKAYTNVQKTKEWKGRKVNANANDKLTRVQWLKYKCKKFFAKVKDLIAGKKKFGKVAQDMLIKVTYLGKALKKEYDLDQESDQTDYDPWLNKVRLAIKALKENIDSKDSGKVDDLSKKFKNFEFENFSDSSSGSSSEYSSSESFSE